MQDASLIKERIITVLKQRGPSLPIHISKEISSTILFSSAFLSELVSENRIKVSAMRVGSSPIYYLIGQENMLEKFADYLKSKEKDAFFLLKEKRFLMDSEQNPAIRVAIREIKDFAIPFKRNEDVIWRYFLTPESEFISKEVEPVVIEIKEPKKESIKAKEIEVIQEDEKVAVTEKEEIISSKEKKSQKKEKKQVRKKSGKKDESFFSSVKEFISSRSIELLDIQNFGGKEIILKVKENNEEKLLIAYNKNRITENDILKASKKAVEMKMKYIIIGKGGPLKKVEGLISAIKDLSFIEKVR